MTQEMDWDTALDEQRRITALNMAIQTQGNGTAAAVIVEKAKKFEKYLKEGK